MHAYGMSIRLKKKLTSILVLETGKENAIFCWKKCKKVNYDVL